MTGDYKLINIEKLATCLAEDAWAHETKSVPKNDLYQMIATLDETNEAVMSSEIKPEWATSFFNIREEYLKLISQFIK